MSKHVKYGIQIVAPADATGQMQTIYQQMRRELGATPEPFSLHSPSPDVFAGIWMLLRETLLAGKVDHGLKQAIAATVSEINVCLWCVDAHSAILYAAKRGDAVHAITTGEGLDGLDRTTRAHIEWAQATRTPDAAVLRQPPFSIENMPEIIGTALTFHFLNRMVNAALSETFLPNQTWLHTPFKRTVGWIARRMGLASPDLVPGETLTYLPDAPLPDDMAWAQSAPAIRGAIARFAAVIETIAARMPPDVRRVVENHIQTWQGEDPGLSRKWVEDGVANLEQSHRTIARLALLAALAPHQIAQDVISDFRIQHPEDNALIDVLAWGSFSAARRVGTWLAVPALSLQTA